ncbi:hypothetical protein HZC07_00610 [Candidatus Micrarchaeota archaeon]|nr:hypothetical protein [Candidatus Micrarchaeota archaeon]
MEKTKTAFVETFGESPTIKVLDFFLTFSEFDYSKTQVAQEIGISRITIEPIWEKLVKDNFVKKSRTIGRAEMYVLNKSNPRVKELLELDRRLSAAADEDIERNAMTTTALSRSSKNQIRR